MVTEQVTEVIRDGVYRSVRKIGKGRHGCCGEFVACTVTSSSLAPISSLPGTTMPEAPVLIAELRIAEEMCGGGVLILRIQGQLDVATVLSFRDAAFTAIGRRPKALMLDLRQLEETDINGISALITVCRVARLMKTRLYVLPSPSLRAMMERIGVSHQVNLVESTDVPASDVRNIVQPIR